MTNPDKAPPREPQCPRTKSGEYNPLRCCRPMGHEGYCNWVVAGPAYAPPPAHPTLPNRATTLFHDDTCAWKLNDREMCNCTVHERQAASDKLYAAGAAPAPAGGDRLRAGLDVMVDAGLNTGTAGGEDAELIARLRNTNPDTPLSVFHEAAKRIAYLSLRVREQDAWIQGYGQRTEAELAAQAERVAGLELENGLHRNHNTTLVVQRDIERNRASKAESDAAALREQVAFIANQMEAWEMPPRPDEWIVKEWAKCLRDAARQPRDGDK